jgi:hypothetical protein
MHGALVHRVDTLSILREVKLADNYQGVGFSGGQKLPTYTADFVVLGLNFVRTFLWRMQSKIQSPHPAAAVVGADERVIWLACS